jgi:hypothetical protein
VRLAALAWLRIVGTQVASGDFLRYFGPGSAGFGPPARETVFQLVVAVLPLLALALSWWYVPLTVYVGAFMLEAFGFPNAGGMPWDSPDPWRGWASWAVAFAPVVACALARPRSGEPRDSRSLLWIPGAALLGALTAWQSLYLSSWLGRPLAVVLLAAVVLARRDPRLAVGAACFAALAVAERLIFGWQAVIWLGTESFVTPLLLTLVLACVWRLRPRAAF